jgi:6-phosphogluconolactonase/glucosamine-6-phosphate isomerase/deaminase
MKCIPSSGWEEGIAALTERLMSELTARRKVLWLLSGGSNIATAVEIMSSLPARLTTDLTVTLADERYGPLGHAESNWDQLQKSGLATKRAHLRPVLQVGQTFEQALRYYQQLIAETFAAADAIIALLGIGADGHLAGILPKSSAARSRALVAGYDSPPLRRLTLTFPALRQVNAAFVFAFGDQKREAIQTLCNRLVSPLIQPAQILRQLPESYIYSDQIGDN